MKKHNDKTARKQYRYHEKNNEEGKNNIGTMMNMRKNKIGTMQKLME